MPASPIRITVCLLLFIQSCKSDNNNAENTVVSYDTAVYNTPLDKVVKDSISALPPTPVTLAITNTNRDSLVNFAMTLLGTPYKYASTNPDIGFDCSGFITYVFNHFNIKVPRSSVDFTNVGKEVQLADAKRGDLILFTGTDSLVRIVGHMGIVTTNDDTLKFIHSSSGKIYGVTETPLNKYYQGRFVKVVDIF